MSEEIKEENGAVQVTPQTDMPLTAKKYDKPVFGVDANGVVKQLSFVLVDNIEEFKARLDKVFEGFQGVFLPTEKNFTHYIGYFRGRLVDDVLDDGEELFKFCDGEILGKNIAETTKQLFLEKLEKFIEGDERYRKKYYYEFIIELGRKGEDITFDEIEQKEVHRGVKDFFPPVDSREINRRMALAKQRYTEEAKKAREELLKASDITKNLEDVCATIEEELKKKEDPKLRKNLEKFQKNIKAIKTLDVLEKVAIAVPKQFKNKSDNEKMRILGLQVNQLLRKDGKTEYDYEKLAKTLSKFVGVIKAVKFILKILAFTRMNNLTSYKIFTIKTLNDLLKLKFNFESEEGKKFIEKVKKFCDKLEE